MSGPGDVSGEPYADDPRERRLRVIAQLVDKPLFLLLVALAFALAARGPELLTGVRPSGWTVLWLWIGMAALARLGIVFWLRRFRARHGIAAQTAKEE